MKIEDEKTRLKREKDILKYNKITYQVDLIIHNECTKYPLQDLILMNRCKIQDEIINAYLNYLQGIDDSVEDYDLIYKDNVSKMNNYLKVLTFLNEHNQNLLADGVEEMEPEDFEEKNFYNSVFKKFDEEVGPIKEMPYIQAIFARAVKEILKKDEKKEEFWQIWLKEYFKKTEPIINYNLDTCPCYPKCLDGKLPHINDFIKQVEYKLLRKYPDISSGRRKVNEQRQYENYDNLRNMCSDPNLYALSDVEIIEPPESCVKPYDEPIVEEESEAEQIVQPPKHTVDEPSSGSTEVSLVLEESELCHLLDKALKLGSFSKPSM